MRPGFPDPYFLSFNDLAPQKPPTRGGCTPTRAPAPDAAGARAPPRPRAPRRTLFDVLAPRPDAPAPHPWRTGPPPVAHRPPPSHRRTPRARRGHGRGRSCYEGCDTRAQGGGRGGRRPRRRRGTSRLVHVSVRARSVRARGAVGCVIIAFPPPSPPLLPLPSPAARPRARHVHHPSLLPLPHPRLPVRRGLPPVRGEEPRRAEEAPARGPLARPAVRVPGAQAPPRAPAARGAGGPAQVSRRPGRPQARSQPQAPPQPFAPGRSRGGTGRTASAAPPPAAQGLHGTPARPPPPPPAHRRVRSLRGRG